MPRSRCARRPEEREPETGELEGLHGAAEFAIGALMSQWVVCCNPSCGDMVTSHDVLLCTRSDAVPRGGLRAPTYTVMSALLRLKSLLFTFRAAALRHASPDGLVTDLAPETAEQAMADSTITGEDFTAADLADCAEREVRQRQRAYPRWIEAGRMTQHLADRQTALMQ